MLGFPQTSVRFNGTNFPDPLNYRSIARTRMIHNLCRDKVKIYFIGEFFSQDRVDCCNPFTNGIFRNFI